MLNVKEKNIAGNLSELYLTDYYTWAMTNSELLKEGKLDEIDYINLAEEVKDLGKSEYYKLESYLANLLSHIYKWDNQPNLRTKSWNITIANSIFNIKKVLKENQGLKYAETFHNIFSSAWEESRHIISNDIDTDIKSVPKECPYSFADIIKKAYDITPDRIDEADIFFLNNLF